MKHRAARGFLDLVTIACGFILCIVALGLNNGWSFVAVGGGLLLVAGGLWSALFSG